MRSHSKRPMKLCRDSRYEAERNATDNVAPIAIWAGAEVFISEVA
jgi:hypothetical protein